MLPSCPDLVHRRFAWMTEALWRHIAALSGLTGHSTMQIAQALHPLIAPDPQMQELMRLRALARLRADDPPPDAAEET